MAARERGDGRRRLAAWADLGALRAVGDRDMIEHRGGLLKHPVCRPVPAAAARAELAPLPRDLTAADKRHPIKPVAITFAITVCEQGPNGRASRGQEVSFMQRSSPVSPAPGP